MKSKKISLKIHIPPRAPGPLSVDERKQLADFFMAIMDLRPKEDEKKEEIYVEHK